MHEFPLEDMMTILCNFLVIIDRVWGLVIYVEVMHAEDANLIVTWQHALGYRPNNIM